MKEFRISKSIDINNTACAAISFLSEGEEIEFVGIGQSAIANMAKVIIKIGELNKDWKVYATPFTKPSIDSKYPEGTIKLGFRVKRVFKDVQDYKDTFVIKVDSVDDIPFVIEKQSKEGCEFISSIPINHDGSTDYIYLVFNK